MSVLSIREPVTNLSGLQHFLKISRQAKAYLLYRNDRVSGLIRQESEILPSYGQKIDMAMSCMSVPCVRKIMKRERVHTHNHLFRKDVHQIRYPMWGALKM